MSSDWVPFVPDQVPDLLARYPGAPPVAVPVRQSAVVLFADLAGFTPLSEALSALGAPGVEELNQLLCGCFGQMIERVVRYGGTVVRFAGDAVTAVFPYDSRTRQPTARSAVQCALDMQAAMAAYHGTCTAAGPFDLAMKIGLAQGPSVGVVFGDPAIRLEYVVMGPAVDRAAAAEHRGTRGEILVDGGMVQGCPGIRVVERRGRAHLVAGLSPPVAAPPAPPPKRVSEAVAARLGPFLHRPIATRLLAGHRGLVNEHRKVSIAFVAFPAAGPLGRDVGTADQIRQMQDYVVAALHTIDRHGGHLLQIDTGDKGNLLVVSFGAPVAHEDNEERAVHCCLDLLHLPGGPFRIGLTSGLAFCGEVGSDRRREYLVMGDSVNLAARLMQAAEPGQLLVDSRTHDGVARSAVQEALTPVTVKGKIAPIHVWAVHGLRDPAPAGAVTSEQMVGREHELARLGALVGRAATGEGRVVALTGDAGVGKSRLAAEVLRTAVTSGFALYQGAARARETTTGYLVWRGVWRHLIGLDADDAVPVQQARLRDYVANLDAGSAQRAPLLAPVVNVPMADSDLTATLDAATRAELLPGLLLDMLRERVSQGPVVVLLEDCHWIDPSSAALLRFLARNTVDQQVLLLVTSRQPLTASPSLDKLTQLPHCAEIMLSELPATEAADLVVRLLRRLYGPATVLLPELVDSLVARGDGNPFYLEELVRFVHDRRADLRDRDTVTAVTLPDTLHGLLTARLDQLDEGQQATVKVASVIGRAFRESWVRGTYPALGGAGVVRSHLDRLHRLGLTPLRSTIPEREYAFRHALTQEAAYDTLTFAMRAELHEAVGQFIERAYPDHLAQHVDALAHHYGRSNDTAKQRTWFRAAGDAARAAFANEVAIAYYRRLLPLLPPQETGDVLVDLGGLWYLTGEWADAEKAYRQAMSVAESMNDRAVVAKSQRDLGILYTYRREYTAAVDWLTRAGMLFERLRDPRGVASTLDRLSFAYFQQGRYAEALEQAERHLAIATAAGDDTGRSAALGNMGLVRWYTGNHAEAIDLLSRALQVAEDAGNHRGVIFAANDLAGVYVQQGDHIRALGHLRQALAAADRIGFRPMSALVIGNAGELYREHSDHDRALKCFTYSLAISFELGNWTSVLTQLGNLGLTIAAQGRMELAERLLDRAVGLARALTAPYLLCEFLPALARLRADQGRLAEAERDNDEALETADRIDHRHHRLHGRLLAIRLAHTAGRIDDGAAADQLHTLLAQWSEPAEQAAVHAELWELTDSLPSRNRAVQLYRELYEQAPSQESRERLMRLSDEPLPVSAPLPPLPAVVARADLDVDAVLRQVDLLPVERLAAGARATP